MKGFYIACGVAIAAVGAMAIYSAGMFRKVLGRSDASVPSRDSELVKTKLQPYADHIYNGVELLHGEKSETVYTQSFDGLKLAAVCLPAEESRATVILMHGFRSSPYWDFAGVIKKYSEMGFNLVLPYQRAHGKSEGKYLTFGVKERRDLLSWVDWTKERFGENEKIIVDGMSMGAATVLMASGLGYPDNVKGIIADCGYTSPYEIISKVMKENMHIPQYPFIWIFGAMCRVFADFSLKECSTVDAMKVNGKPVLFAHGEADDFVPYAMTVENYDACVAEKVLVSVAGADHGISYLVDQKKYDEALDSFLEKNLG
ncbi:MAG: alpha/beta hydrolase [Clostridia bacterium]|nr:alpha/beta hydrolase [Clostridia bacterium]